MVGTHNVMLGSEVIGRVTVTKQGLYYCFDCRCSLTGQVLYKLVITCGGRQENLGVCVPRDGQFGLKTKLPVKRFSGEEAAFRIIPRHERVGGQFVPICPEEPFSYLSQLDKAYLAVRDGRIGVIIAQEQNS